MSDMDKMIEIFETHTKLCEDNKDLLEKVLKEFTNLMKLQAAQANLGNARRELIDNTLQELLNSIAGVGDDSKKLLTHLKEKTKG